MLSGWCNTCCIAGPSWQPVRTSRCSLLSHPLCRTFLACTVLLARTLTRLAPTAAARSGRTFQACRPPTSDCISFSRASLAESKPSLVMKLILSRRHFSISDTAHGRTLLQEARRPFAHGAPARFHASGLPSSIGTTTQTSADRPPSPSAPAHASSASRPANHHGRARARASLGHPCLEAREPRITGARYVRSAAIIPRRSVSSLAGTPSSPLPNCWFH